MPLSSYFHQAFARFAVDELADAAVAAVVHSLEPS
jgi:hypothetical protein